MFLEKPADRHCHISVIYFMTSYSYNPVLNSSLQSEYSVHEQKKSGFIAIKLLCI